MKPSGWAILTGTKRRSGEDTLIEVGSKAPEFKLGDHFGRTMSLSQFAGKKHVMLLMYPLDFTPT